MRKKFLLENGLTTPRDTARSKDENCNSCKKKLTPTDEKKDYKEFDHLKESNHIDKKPILKEDSWENWKNMDDD